MMLRFIGRSFALEGQCGGDVSHRPALALVGLRLLTVVPADRCWTRSARQPPTKDRRTERCGLSVLVSTRQIDCQVPSAGRPSMTGMVSEGETRAGRTWSRPWPGLP